MRPNPMFCFSFSVLLVLLTLSEARSCPIPLTNNASQRAQLAAKDARGLSLGNCEHMLTHVQVYGSPLSQEVVVTEKFRNNFREGIHGYYSLPLPQDAVVRGIEIQVGERRIEANYNEYPPESRPGSSDSPINDTDEIARLIDKDYSGTFAQPIPNILPGEEIEVRIRYVEQVTASNPIPYPESGEEDFCEEGSLRRCDYRLALIYLVLMLLVLYAVGVFVERVMCYGAARNQSRYYSARVNPFLHPDQLPEARKISGFYPKSPVANIMSAVFSTVEESPRQLSSLAELCGSARRRAIALSEAELRRGLSGLKSSAWLALLVGALGTVIQLVDVFQGAMIAEGAGVSMVAGGVAESFNIALFGLLIFLPAIWAGRFLSAKAAKIGLETDKSSWELVDALLKRRSEERLLNQLQTPIWSDC
jgi:biopolymer transport protein ExbB/TolQ